MRFNPIEITEKKECNLLLIYTGGTFGMAKDSNNSLTPVDFKMSLALLPELHAMEVGLSVISFHPPIDSSDVNKTHWEQMTKIISDLYHQFDAFIILHGTDTMAYSASILSFTLQNLNKPIIFTGAQMPIGSIRSDARENLITAIEIASVAKKHNTVNEVCIYFNSFLLRGCRSYKIRSSKFSAFASENYPILAEVGIDIEFNTNALYENKSEMPLLTSPKLSNQIAVLKLYPGISPTLVDSILSSNVKGIIMESFGSGNTMTESWFTRALEDCVKKEKIIFNVSQCHGGQVVQGKYATSSHLQSVGVVSGKDITTEAAIAKMMHLLPLYSNEYEVLKKHLSSPLVGEMSH